MKRVSGGVKHGTQWPGKAVNPWTSHGFNGSHESKRTRPSFLVAAEGLRLAIHKIL